MQHLNVLLIEDWEDDARIMIGCLRDGGYEPSWHRVWDEAGVRKAFEKRDWDLVLCDHRMPRLDAPRALRLMREADLEIPFVLVSGRIGEATVVALMKAGIADYVRKDDLTELAPVVRRVLDEHRLASEHKRAQQGLELLADATATIAYSLDLDAVVQELAGLVVTHLADACLVEVAIDGNRRHATSSAHVDPYWEAAMRACEPVPWSGDEPRSFDGSTPEVIAALGLRDPALEPDVEHALFVPLFSPDRVAGSIRMARGARRRRFDELDLRIAGELAARITSVLESAALLRETERARGEAEAANRLKDEFLAVASHELRTPMTSIIGYTRLLLGDALPQDRRKRALEVIDRNTSVLARVLDDLVDYARISSGRLHIGLAPVWLAIVAEYAVAAIQPAAEAKQIDIRLTVEPATTTRGDLVRLQQVATVLLANAVRYTPTGGRVDVAVERRGEHVELRVADNGQGIDPAFLPFVFDRFKQGSVDRDHRQSGLGLGLAIAKHLVELHDGRIEAHSGGAGCGSTFVVRLPLFETGMPAVQIAAPIGTSRSLEGLRILVVDDDESSRLLLDGILELHGGDVIVAASVSEAIDAFVDSPPDLMLSDLSMPGETGFDLLRHIRKLPAARGGRIPAIAVSAFARHEDRTAALEAGFARFLAKPIDPRELVGVISQVASMRPT